MGGRGDRVVVEDILWRIDEAWSQDRWHALCFHLEGLTWDEATWPPVEGRRTIVNVLAHLGLCKIMYREHAFGAAKMTWPEAGAQVPEGEDLEIWRAWLEAAHQQLRDSVAGLTDPDLDAPRLTNWGEQLPTRTIINVMIEHDLYHAGEINYIRGLYRAHLTGEPSSWTRWAQTEE